MISENTEVFLSIMRALTGDLDKEKLSRIIADRLHRAEMTAQDKIKNIQEIKKGSLVQVLINENDSDEMHFIIAKVEDNYFLDKATLTKSVGLPWGDSTFKYARFSFSREIELIDIMIFDANPKVSDYWYKSFLELRESNTDEYNTKTAFNSIKAVLDRQVKTQSRQDYTILRNAIINYFRSHETILYEQLMQEVFDNYQPENPEYDIGKLKEKLRQLPESKKFDRSFRSITSEIKARIVQRYEISDKIELKVKDSLENLKETIYSLEEPDGKRFVKILVSNPDTFEAFNFNRENSKG